MRFGLIINLMFLLSACSLFRNGFEQELIGNWNMTAYVKNGTNLNLSLTAYFSYVFGFELYDSTGMKWTGSRAGMGGYSDKWTWASDGTNLTMSSSSLGAAYSAVYTLLSNRMTVTSFKASGQETLGSNSYYTFSRE